MSPTSSLPQLPAGPGGSGAGGGSSDGGTGGHSGGGFQSGVGAGLISLLTLVLLRLVRRAAAKPIWRSCLPEVPPA